MSAIMDKRMQWRGKLEFLFACFGYSIGLGNIWRFPYRCYTNGGGAFLFPYLVATVFCTFPLLLMEMFLGQFASQGPITVWKFCPIFEGAGWAMIFNVCMTNISYVVLVMYALFYMLVAFVNIGQTPPWQHCNHGNEETWNTDLCRAEAFPNFDALTNDNDKINAYMEMLKPSCTITQTATMTFAEFKAVAKNRSCEILFTSPEEEFWNRFVLGAHASSGVNDLGNLNARNALALAFVWLFIFYICVKGIRSLSKVIYLTASIPLFMLIILLARGLTLDGYEIGVRFYTTPDWSKLGDMSIWASASTQAMYSVGVAFGSHIALSSHNQFNSNCIRDAVILICFNSITSLLSGFVVFSFLGHASVKLNRPLEEIFDHGPGIIFISYLQGISQLPGSAVWAFLFFMVVFTLGVDSMFVMVWTVYEAIEDNFGEYFRKYGKHILLGMCVVQFCLGIPLVTQGGIHMFVVMDRYTSDFNLCLFLILECVAVCWVYGLKRCVMDIELMLGHLPTLFKAYLFAAWALTAPAFCLFIFVASGVGYTSVSYNGIRTTSGGEAIGILLIAAPAVIAIGVAVFKVKRIGGIKLATCPTEDWGPRLLCNRKGPYIEEGYITPVHVSNSNESSDSSTSSPGYINSPI